LGNLGLSWLATVFFAVATGYWLQQFCATVLVSPHPGSELNDFALFDLFGLVVVTALGSAVIGRTLTGAALEPRQELMTAYLAIGSREWLAFLSLLRLYVIVIAGLFAVVLAGGAAISLARPMIGNLQWQGVSAFTAAQGLVGLVAFAVVATILVRLGFFVAPVASAERSASASRAWSLSRGNSWRLFAASLVLGVPALLLWLGAEWFVIGGGLGDALRAAFSPSHDSTAFYQLIQQNAPAVAATWAVLILVWNMVFAGASAHAYGEVRDNVDVRKTQPAISAPDLEPAFAGSFAGFAPRYAKEPVAHDAEPPLHDQPHDVFVMSAPPVEVHPHHELSDAPPLELAPAESEGAAAEPAGEHMVAEGAAAHEDVTATDSVPHAADQFSEPVAIDPSGAYESFHAGEDTTPSFATAKFPLAPVVGLHESGEVLHATAEAADEISHEPLEPANEVIPLPSYGDATESSLENVPSEAA
jgi:hypothetical protein